VTERVPAHEEPCASDDGKPGPDLETLVRDELLGAATDACGELAAEIRRRRGESLAAVLFYGSCLRNQTREGVLDFYALVDDYRGTYGPGALAFSNAVLPPNVFYLEHAGQRAKLAVLSLRDFARAAGGRAIRPAIWARFCQPFAVAWARDDAARERVIGAAADAIRTAVIRGLGLLPSNGRDALFTPEDLWTALFRETYGSELRTESDDSVRRLYRANAQRYDRVLDAVLDEFEARQLIELERRGRTRVVSDAAELLARPRRARRVVAKGIGAVQLVKSAVTFGDWMPYALWKLERHTGTRLEPSERQRRHPFLFGWPLVVRALAKRDLR
jgi:hypothetical protein